jgi:hypothetical protein
MAPLVANRPKSNAASTDPANTGIDEDDTLRVVECLGEDALLAAILMNPT